MGLHQTKTSAQQRKSSTKRKCLQILFGKELTSKIYKELIRQQKKIFFNVKMSLKRLFQRHLDGQQVHLHIQYEVLNITNHQGNVNQNYNEIPPHTFRNGYYQKDNK